MKPAPFEYFAPRTVDEALGLLERRPEARPLAGGQSLVPMMNLRLAQPEALVDLNRTEGLADLEPDGDGIRIGAMVRHCELERSPLVAARAPLLRETIAFVAHPAIRHRGTVGGSAAHADPAAELPVALTACDATFVVRGPGGTRELAADAFFVDLYTTALAPGELLVAIRVPARNGSTGVAFEELARRHNDFPVAAVAACIGLDARGRCNHARIVLGAVAPGSGRAREAEDLLLGAEPSAEAIAEAAARAAASASPLADLHGSAEYRRRVAQALARRALARAAARARATA